MLINAEQLLQYQRCKRRPFLDVYGDKKQRDAANDLLQKLQHDKIAHQSSILTPLAYHQPDYSYGDWEAGAAATIKLMQQGVDCIYKGVLLTTYNEKYTLLSRPDLLFKQPGESCFGDWMYAPATIELGKRPKQEYQILAAYHAQVLATVQEVEPEVAWLMLRTKQTSYEVDLGKWTLQMRLILEEFIETLELSAAPEVFIARQKCNLCHWYSYCYAIAQSEKHLSLLPGVTPGRYAQLQALDIHTVESLAKTLPRELEKLPGFDHEVALKLVVQAEAVAKNRPFILPYAIPTKDIIYTAPIEIYFDIEAQPDLNLDYLLGVLVVDKKANTEKFYSFLAENVEEEESIWRQFLDLVWQYPDAPIYHFCLYELDTVKRLAKLYHTPYKDVAPVLNRFVDVYEDLIQSVALPIESYALKAIAKWLGFEWRDLDASGAKCIYWYDKWLETGDRTLLEIIQRYNEDDCRATRSVKDWLSNFFQNESILRHRITSK